MANMTQREQRRFQTPRLPDRYDQCWALRSHRSVTGYLLQRKYLHTDPNRRQRRTVYLASHHPPEHERRMPPKGVQVKKCHGSQIFYSWIQCFSYVCRGKSDSTTSTKIDSKCRAMAFHYVLSTEANIFLISSRTAV